MAALPPIIIKLHVFGDQTMYMYGEFAGFPINGNIMTPGLWEKVCIVPFSLTMINQNSKGAWST